jgi:multisubunit Na+/H+ antiporter MnhB subunit
MNNKINWLRLVFILGLIAVIAGALDPLEGSVVIAVGSVLIALSTNLTKDRHEKIFLYAAVLIVVGVAFLFYISSLGGFGGTSTLSWWWGLLIIPYPLGWLITIGTLLYRAFNKKVASEPIV